jgi:cytochrome c biogenesis protein CcmG/thiol:disulfide interchange protein DsbE
LPQLQKIYEKYRSNGLEIIAVDISDRTADAQRFIENEKLTFTFFEQTDPENNPVKDIFKIPGVPVTYLIDEQGKIIYKHLGFKRGDEEMLQAKIEKLLVLD